jgi:hypothetical protein
MSIYEKIKLLLKLNSAVNGIKEAQMKSGWKTSEFWTVVLSQAVPIIIALWGFIPATVMVQIMSISGILAGVYALSRAFVKASGSKLDDEKFNKIVSILDPVLDKIGIHPEPIEIEKDTIKGDSSIPINTPK